MNTFWEGVQWILSAGGAIGAVSTFFLHTKLNKQKYKLDKLKTQFDYLVIERNKITSALNTRISDIEVWITETKRLDDSDFIDVYRFRKLVRQYEKTLIHGRYLLSTALYEVTNQLLDVFNHSITIYEDEQEKLGYEPLSIPPEITFVNELFKPEVEELIKTAKWRLGNEIINEDE